MSRNVNLAGAASESQEQRDLFHWAARSAGRLPELHLLHAIPNGGARSAVTGARLKAEGVKKGVPDICLPVPRGGFHGLYIELKRVKGGRVSDEQRWWLGRLTRYGYLALVCKGWQEAAKAIEDYLGESEK